MKSSRPPRLGIVNLAALDLRRRPDHKSELRSQLLIGEAVRVLALALGSRWWRVQNRSDGYTGWIRSWGVVPATLGRARAWERRARARVVSAYAEARERPGSGALVTPLFWNGRVIPGQTRKSHTQVEIPDGRRGWVSARSLGRVGAAVPTIAARLRQLLGVPYLWGGRTALGFDCSGFVQQVLWEQGLRIPRDAEGQFRASRRLEPEQAKEGDLVFFGPRRGPKTHVALLLGGGYYAHARGRVMVGSLDPINPLYDKALGRQQGGFGRPRRRLGA